MGLVQILKSQKKVSRNILVKIDFVVLSCSLGVQITGSECVEFSYYICPIFLAQLHDGDRGTYLITLI